MTDNSYAGDKVAAILPFLYNGKGPEGGTVNENKESYTKPTPLGFYYKSGVYYSDFIYNYTLGRNPGAAAESSAGSGKYRYTMRSDWEFTKSFSAEELKNVSVSIAFDKGTVTQEESWVMFTSIAGKKLSTDFYSIDINYETFGGTIQDSEYTQKLSSSDDQVPLLPTNIANEHYTFMHWYYGTNPENKVNEDGFTEWLHEQNEAITLSAYYVPVNYEISYDLNYSGATAWEKDTVTVLNYQGYTFKQVSVEDCPEGKIFDGWYTQATGGEKVTQISSLQNITVYAHWLDGYVVTFVNGATQEQIFYPAGSVVAQPQVTDKTGYTFDGWFNGNEVYDFTSVLTGNLTLTAKYTLKTFTVKFYAVGEMVEEKTVTYGQTVSQLPSVPEATTGYGAGVWQYGDKPFTSEFVVDKDLTVVAVYPKQSVEVTFAVNGGSQIEKMTIVYGETIDGKELSTSKYGYNLVGWQYNGQAYDFSTAVTQNMELTAVWALKEYKITVMQNGESVGTITKKHGEKISVQEVSSLVNTPVKQLYMDISLTTAYDVEQTVEKEFSLYVETEFSQPNVVFIVTLSVSVFVAVASVVGVILVIALKRKGEKVNEN